MRRTLTAMVAAGALLAVSPGIATAKEYFDSKALRKAVTVDRIMGHEQALQDIADANGGTRASGTPGFAASADYVAGVLQKAGYTVTRQTFEFPFFQELSTPTLQRTSPSPRTYAHDTEFVTMDYSGSGDVTAKLTPVDLVLPPTAEPSSTSGCESSDFSGFPAGNIALIQRGTCTFGTKAQNAKAAGASGVIIFNEGQEGRTDVVHGTLGDPVSIPVVSVSFADGNELAGLSDVTMHIVTDTLSETRTTQNVFGDSKKGDPNKTIVVGSHLDSVIAGPGINDNGSGTATDLAVAQALGKDGAPRNRVRFAFWGAEEGGLLGSTHYVTTLPADQLSQIKANLNFDMLGSPNFVRFVYDGDGSAGGNDPGPNGSALIERIFNDYFASQGLAVNSTPFDGRSDYGPFIDAGVPAGGLFSGAEGVKTADQASVFGGIAGDPFDSCYHQACDTIDNLNATSLDQLSDAVAHAVLQLSRTKSTIADDSTIKGKKPKKAKTMKGPKAVR